MHRFLQSTGPASLLGLFYNASMQDFVVNCHWTCCMHFTKPMWPQLGVMVARYGAVRCLQVWGRTGRQLLNIVLSATKEWQELDEGSQQRLSPKSHRWCLSHTLGLTEWQSFGIMYSNASISGTVSVHEKRSSFIKVPLIGMGLYGNEYGSPESVPLRQELSWKSVPLIRALLYLHYLANAFSRLF